MPAHGGLHDSGGGMHLPSICSAFPHRLLITLCITLGREQFSAVVMGGFIGLPADWAGPVPDASIGGGLGDLAERRPVEGTFETRPFDSPPRSPMGVSETLTASGGSLTPPGQAHAPPF